MADNYNFVVQQIANGTYSLSQRRKGRSFMWNVLTEILKEDGSVLEGLVYCRNCNKIFKCVANQTSNLSRHKCCVVLKQTEVLQTVNAAESHEAANTCAAWLIKDCRPISFINGSGFINVAKFLIKIGATYGENVDLSDLLPDTATISHRVITTAEEKRDCVANEIKDAVNNGGATATIHMWPDNYVNRNLLIVTLHYQKDLKLFDIILGVKTMDFQKSTCENILNKLKTLFNKFGIEDFESVKFVTATEINIMKALENYTRLNCSSHLFANVLDKSFQETAELTKTLEACKQIVQYFKKANLQHNLPMASANLCPTRYNSNYTLLKSIVDNWYNVNPLLTENEDNKELNVSPHTIHILTVLVELCNDFETVFQKLQDSSTPSLCFVLPSIQKIKSLCLPNSADVPAILALKRNITQNIERIWEHNLTIWHKAALFLVPPAVRMQPNDLEAIKEFCTTQTEKITTSTPLSSLQPKLSLSNDASFNNSNPPSPASPTSKSGSELSFSASLSEANQPSHRQFNQFFFSNLIGKSTQKCNESVRHEVERYCREIVPMTGDFDLIDWWKNNVKSYPCLSKFALQIHSIPASSAAADRAFSLARNIITEKRNRFETKSLDSILFLHSFYQNFEN